MDDKRFDADAAGERRVRGRLHSSREASPELSPVREARRKPGRPKSSYKGVRRAPDGRWFSELRYQGKVGSGRTTQQLMCGMAKLMDNSQTHSLGTFDTAMVAAHAYDEASRRLCGPLAPVNGIADMCAEEEEDDEAHLNPPVPKWGRRCRVCI